MAAKISVPVPDITYWRQRVGADPGIFERGGPEAIIYKILERGGPKSLKMAFECSFQSFSYKSFANIPQKGGGGAGPLGPSPKSATGASPKKFGFADYHPIPFFSSGNYRVLGIH